MTTNPQETREIAERLRPIIKKWNKDRNDPFFKTEKGKEIAKRFLAIEEIMES